MVSASALRKLFYLKKKNQSVWGESTLFSFEKESLSPRGGKMAFKWKRRLLQRISREGKNFVIGLETCLALPHCECLSTFPPHIHRRYRRFCEKYFVAWHSKWTPTVRSSVSYRVLVWVATTWGNNVSMIFIPLLFRHPEWFWDASFVSWERTIWCE